MICFLLDHFGGLLEHLQLVSTGDSRVFLTARVAMASVTSFVFAILFGRPAISWLQARFREQIKSASDSLNELHQSKSDTPTMGGLFIVGAVLFAGLLWGDLSNDFVRYGLLLTAGLGLVGALDDWIKLRTEHKGLSPRQKLLMQSMVCAVVAIGLFQEVQELPQGTHLVAPFGSFVIPIGSLFIPWALFVMVGSSNSVNLTDGLDGLAAGCTIFAGGTMAIITYIAGHAVMADYLGVTAVRGAGEVAVLLGSLVGAMLGFLWFNTFPAKVFMGDTGALPVGGLLAYAALVTRQEFVLLICGGIFVAETLSVIAQVTSYKLFGRRVLACSPLHNHYVLTGHHESQVVVRFWIISALLAILALASLKIR
ncbi:phospho-N-acetylmuramoyl-pentapeptide-transferase [Calycomorphotria hydatis]|uniref:Phospho-N-acetylmuramoyl-pentapeptide-transferase n=1 Tax=Calycomorphotria hydatis TaxID=2528027 RepID=A0A517TAA8_9PLAN|nr:phospho-N-acetylmuramoyl-pentapeptide-transferase [Calycomorphotria hydatis]QDT65304.1 Phospho-N-acetylmuramoyl-pentapeptide-transferase MraY [Calycomorphotria hydatis]